MSGKTKLVKWQKTFTKASNKSYDEWVGEAGEVDAQENVLANPDSLAEQPPTRPNRAARYIKKHWREIAFSPREKQILECMLEGSTQEEAAGRLKISRSRVSQALLRIQKKSLAWYGNKKRDGSI